MTTYAEWITCWTRTVTASVHIYGMEHEPLETRLPHAIRGLCRSAVDAMVAAFPELRPVRGHYGGAPHWWCVTPDGTIVDPTAAQFMPGGTYVEYTGPEPIGKCMNCGEYVWEGAPHSAACSEDCARELEQEYNLPIRGGQ